jgi:hypothetical protein
MDPFSRLPAEIRSYILSFVVYTPSTSLPFEVCKEWRSICLDLCKKFVTLEDFIFSAFLIDVKISMLIIDIFGRGHLILDRDGDCFMVNCIDRNDEHPTKKDYIFRLTQKCERCLSTSYIVDRDAREISSSTIAFLKKMKSEQGPSAVTYSREHAYTNDTHNRTTMKDLEKEYTHCMSKHTLHMLKMYKVASALRGWSCLCKWVDTRTCIFR